MIDSLKAKIDEVYRRAERVYDREFERPLVSLDLKGRASGMADYRNWTFRVNSQCLENYPTQYLEDTVPHECGHFISRELYGWQIKPHGREWKAVVRAIGGVPKRCHNYNLSPAVNRKYFIYSCKCGNLDISSTIHNRIKKGKNYFCRKCRNQIRYVAPKTNA